MKYTLLELVQQILRSMGSDNVNSINDTEESQDVAHIVKEVYFDIVGHHAMAEHEGLFQLNPSGDNTKPCYMTLPSNALSMAWYYH